MLKKYKGTETEFSPIYFNSTTKTVINNKFDLDKSFQEILCGTENWINEESRCIIESINSQGINISTYRPLIGRSYMKLLGKLRNPKKVLIDKKIMIKNLLFGVILYMLIQ